MKQNRNKYVEVPKFTYRHVSEGYTQDTFGVIRRTTIKGLANKHATSRNARRNYRRAMENVNWN